MAFFFSFLFCLSFASLSYQHPCKTPITTHKACLQCRVVREVRTGSAWRDSPPQRIRILSAHVSLVVLRCFSGPLDFQDSSL
ncbi:hypothetical protein BU25DRAFT_193792 [Macroventuria anomochaeta]|uniref:Uncharacterized protein n=1 Tax=Macroventuria anomochaeta TaxID=301207 RepID=A0ACB6SC89_9PLEO|nr:uncharacterized protein BU25DRAFT_193792 [Macroventuria anomochaeta]KAF2631669.1 hypothetical protein BU25DRAFT_193792 [Macroventuria anomochaeta]